MNQEMHNLYEFNKFCKENAISYEVNTANELIGLAVAGLDFDVYNEEQASIEMGTSTAVEYVRKWYYNTEG